MDPVPRTVTVTGSFHHKNGRPVQGLVRFTPGRLWVIEGTIAWACLAPEPVLAADGSFSVQLTPTNTDSVWWRYRVDTPAGSYEVSVPWVKTGYTLRELVDEHRSGTRAAD
jgi:hypothetical protein